MDSLRDWRQILDFGRRPSDEYIGLAVLPWLSALASLRRAGIAPAHGASFHPVFTPVSPRFLNLMP